MRTSDLISSGGPIDSAASNHQNYTFANPCSEGAEGVIRQATLGGDDKNGGGNIKVTHF